MWETTLGGLVWPVNLACAKSDSMTPDLTVLLNVHDDAKYLKRTLQSLEECAAYGRAFDISTVLLVVADRASADTLAFFKTYRSPVFASIKVIKVDNGDLALSRNDGIAAASGELLMTADADDLVSFNTIADAVTMFRIGKLRKTVIVPQYHYRFGQDFSLRVNVPLDVIDPILFFEYHPYGSRIIGRREELRSIAYVAHKAHDGLAFEDWHYNSELLAAGFTFVVGKDTILFYRRAADRMNALSTAKTFGVTALSRLHDPDVFKALGSRSGKPIQDLPVPSPRLELDTLMTSHTCHELMLAASGIEPAINLASLSKIKVRGGAWRTMRNSLHYLELCRRFGAKRFDHVVLLPFLVNSGAEKYILAILHELVRVNPGSRVLFLTGQKWDEHEGMDRLPPGSEFVDLDAFCGDMDERHRQILVLRILQVFAPNALIHMKSCAFARDFFTVFGKVLTSHRAVFYRFCENHGRRHSDWVATGRDFDFVSDMGDRLSLVVTDTRSLAEHDRARLDFISDKIKPIYIHRDMTITPAQMDRPFTRKLLWASRFDAQKRPELAALICEALARQLPDIEIHVHGADVLHKGKATAFSRCSNVKMKGAFDTFATINAADYDALIYTTAFDGLPNIILECMAAGITVIAPNIGGIGEVITGETGFLIADETDDVALVEAYTAAVTKLYSSHSHVAQLRQAALAKLEEQHNTSIFRDRVAECFGPLKSQVTP